MYSHHVFGRGARRNRPRSVAETIGRIPAGKSRRACQAGRRGQKIDPAIVAEKEEAETITSNSLPTKATTEAKKNQKNERNSGGIRASPLMVDQKNSR